MKTQHFDWDIMLFNFNEAWEELEIMLDRAVRQRDDNAPDGRFSIFALKISLGHAYHHVNFAWNSRHVERARVIRCGDRDFNAWDRFPRQFKSLWPSPSRCRGKPRRTGPGGRLSFGPMVENIKAAIAAMSSMCKAIEANADMTEAELVRHMTRLYECMNRI